MKHLSQLPQSSEKVLDVSRLNLVNTFVEVEFLAINFLLKTGLHEVQVEKFEESCHRARRHVLLRLAQTRHVPHHVAHLQLLDRPFP